MRQKFSTSWASSKQPRKQRKYRYNAPLHLRQKLVSAHLSPSLRERLGKRSLPLRKGDEVVVMRGSKAGTRGVVDSVDLNKLKVYVDTIKVKKVDGSEVHSPIHPSNIMIVEAKMDDKMRMKRLRGKASGTSKAEKPAKEKTKKKSKLSKGNS